MPSQTPIAVTMNGVSRFLSRRDKKHKSLLGEKAHAQHHPHIPKEFYRIFHPEDHKKIKNEGDKVREVVERLRNQGIIDLDSSHCEYALRSRSSEGDVDKAYNMLLAYEDALHGTIKDYDPNVKLLGAENRELVSCYLDSLLFAMYARFDSFEDLLAKEFEDEERRKLVTMLRLWVNLLRTGKLITIDVTKHLQEALAACGWDEAVKIRQQDVSEAFTFITDKLELPLLTLKMDVYHTGKADSDDHRIVKERLLEVALPDPPTDGSVVKLEDCLESYFNNRIEVRRHLQRRNTLQSLRATSEKAQIIQSEAYEFGPESPSAISPPPPFSPREQWQASSRSQSIFSSRRMSLIEGQDGEKKTRDDSCVPTKRPRAGTVRREVLMPAWQFFSLIPWYTPGKPANDVQVAQIFSSKRPVLGICLKRYSMTNQGVSTRLDTYIDIPIEIGLPHFISEESADHSFNFNNFKLSLQSVICHRGKSLDSGHYIALVRGDASNAVPGSPSSSSTAQPSTTTSPNQSPLLNGQIPSSIAAAASNPSSVHPPVLSDDDHRRPTGNWMLFDDLAKDRVTYVDIQKALKDECPYLLFYQVQPIDEEPFGGAAPPSYDSIMNNASVTNSSPTSSVHGTAGTNEQISDSLLSDRASSRTSSLYNVETTAIDFSKGSGTQRTMTTDTNATLMPSTTSGTIVPLLQPKVESLEKPDSTNIGSLASTENSHIQDPPPPRLHSGPLKERPKSIDLTTLSRLPENRSMDPFRPGPPTSQNSLEMLPESRTSMSSMRRASITFTEPSIDGSVRGRNTTSVTGGPSAPITPMEELEKELSHPVSTNAERGGSLRAAFKGMSRRRRGSSIGAKAGGASTSTGGLVVPGSNDGGSPALSKKNTRSRPVSQSGENRLSLNISGLNLGNMNFGSKLRAAVSKDRLGEMNNGQPPNSEEPASAATVTAMAPSTTMTTVGDNHIAHPLMPPPPEKEGRDFARDFRGVFGGSNNNGNTNTSGATSSSTNKGSVRRGKSLHVSRRGKEAEKGERLSKEKTRSASTNRLSAMMGGRDYQHHEGAGAGAGGHSPEGGAERPERECVVM